MKLLFQEVAFGGNAELVTNHLILITAGACHIFVQNVGFQVKTFERRDT